MTAICYTNIALFTKIDDRYDTSDLISYIGKRVVNNSSVVSRKYYLTFVVRCEFHKIRMIATFLKKDV
jgi:hypothetical protein